MPSASADQSGDPVERPKTLREEIARQVLAKHYERVKRRVKSRLNARIRQKEGTSAIAQDIYKSFLESNADLSDPELIWPKLLRFAERKIKNAARRYQPEGKRDVSREEPLESTSTPDQDSAVRAKDCLEDRREKLAADEAVVIVDELERLPENERLMVLLRCLGGSTFEQIADQLGTTEGTVRRTLECLFERWRDERLME